MAKIVCEECGTEYKYEVAKNMKNCPVCGALMMGDDDFSHMESSDKNSGQDVEKKTYYYYKEGGGTLDNMLFKGWKPLYTFQATDIKDAKRQLSEVCPNSPLLKTAPSKVIRCPRCLGTEYTLLNKGFSIFTGFLGSGRVKRVCNYCKKEF